MRDEFGPLMPVQALELLDGMLALDPAKRWSARQALDAEWLRYFVYLSIYSSVDWFRTYKIHIVLLYKLHQTSKKQV